MDILLHCLLTINIVTFSPPFFFRLGERQIVNLIKIQAFCRDTSLLESRQAEIRKSCLYYWNVPDRARRADKRVPEEISESILRKYGATSKLTGITAGLIIK